MTTATYRRKLIIKTKVGYSVGNRVYKTLTEATDAIDSEA